MKKTLLVLSCLFAFSQLSISQKDSATAAREHQIKQFWMVILKTGPKDKEITDTVQRDKLFGGHFANMNRLHEEGLLKAAGPFGKNDYTWRGLFILDCATRDEALALVNTDPAVRAGIFIVDLIPWYSEASGSFAPGKPGKAD